MAGVLRQAKVRGCARPVSLGWQRLEDVHDLRSMAGKDWRLCTAKVRTTSIPYQHGHAYHALPRTLAIVSTIGAH